MATIEVINDVRQRVEDRLLAYPNVTGIAIGRKQVTGRETDEFAILVYVSEKRAMPDSQTIPKQIDGVSTDVIERMFVPLILKTPVDHLPDLLAPIVDPLVGGVSIGPCRSFGGFFFTGTLGAMAFDLATGQPALLSNFHVMVPDGNIRIGDAMSQPSIPDGGFCPSTSAGSLTAAVLNESIDGAVALQTARQTGASIVGIDALIGTGTPAKGMRVRKSGRTTGVTVGLIDSTDTTVVIDYGPPRGKVTLRNVVNVQNDMGHSRRFSAKGDSGSVVVNENGWIVGLLFAGTEDGSQGSAISIDTVIAQLNVRLHTPPFGSHWQQLPGAATDIGVGADGSVWVIGTAPCDEHGCGIFRFDGSGFTQVEGAAIRIAVDQGGNPWVVNRKGGIFRRRGGRFEQLPGAAIDIGVGADGSVWVIGIGLGPDGFPIFRWNGSGWNLIFGAGVSVAVGPNGLPWVTNLKAGIFRRV